MPKVYRMSNLKKCLHTSVCVRRAWIWRVVYGCWGVDQGYPGMSDYSPLVWQDLEGGKKLRTFIRCYVWPGGVYFTMRTVGIEEWDAVYLLSEMCSPTKEHLLSYNQFNGNAIYFPMLSISSFGVKNHQKLLHHNQCLAKSASDWRRSQVRERTCREGSVLQAINSTVTLKLTEIIDDIYI